MFSHPYISFTSKWFFCYKVNKLVVNEHMLYTLENGSHSNIVSKLIPILLQKKFLNSVCQICRFLPISSSLLMGSLSNQIFSYSSVLENYRAKALNNKLSDLYDAHLCRTVMKQVLLKLPIRVCGRTTLLAVVLKQQLKQ